MKVSRSSIARVVEACLGVGARRATVFLSPKLTVKATRRHKMRGGECRTELVLTIGRPNYSEREYIKLCQDCGEKFPVKRIKLDWFK